MSVFGLTLDGPILFQGLVVGIPYGLLAVGLVLVYKVSRFINFAQGALGAFGGALVGTMVVSYGVPYWAAFVVGVLVAAGVAAAAEATIVRRLAGQPRLLGVVITLLLAQLLLGMSFAVNTEAQFGSQYPKPVGFPSFGVGTFIIVPSYTALMVFGPLVVIALLVLLRRTRFGLAIRATASNPDAAFSSGVSPTKIAGRAWALAGGVAAFSAILLWPTQGTDVLASLGPTLMLRGLVAAAVAQFDRVGVAFAAGVGIGVLDVLVRNSSASSGLADLILTVIALVVLLARPPKNERESGNDGNWTKLSLRPINPAYTHIWLARNFAIVMTVLTVGFMITRAPAVFLTASSEATLSYVFAFGIIGLSVLVLTGKAGQLSLGQVAVAGVAALVSIKVATATGVFILGPLAAIVVGAIISLILGLPALRSKGLVFAITTLAFALATRSWILPQKWAMGRGLKTTPPTFGSLRIDNALEYYRFSLVVLCIAAAVTYVLINGRFGRDLVALRDNEGAARALGVSATARKIQAFMLAGALAGLGGAILGHSRPLLTPTDFPATSSIDVVVLAVVGGISIVSGPVIGSFLVIGIPLIAGLDPTASAGLQTVFLVLVLFRPSGFLSFMVPVRDWLIEEIARRKGLDPRVNDAVVAPRKTPLASELLLAPTGDSHRPTLVGAMLELDGVSRAFGGIKAVNDVSLSVGQGEAVAIIGPNGAGKTTLFEIASGFVRPNEGTVRFLGADVTGRSPEARSRRGLVRSFQNALLFPTLTVQSTVALALSKSTLGKDRPTVDQILEGAGLTEYRNAVMADLPTGVRRVTELVCDLAVGPQMMLLDEPSAGIAHSEIPALARMLRRMRESFGITLVVIDHDMNLLRAVCDRFVAMELGEVIAVGTADEVTANERVVEAFLGTNVAAVERSAAAVTAD